MERSLNAREEKPLETREQLEAIVLTELQAAPQCAGVSHVTVIAYDDYRVPATGRSRASTRVHQNRKIASVCCVTS
jgi:hypothetical protein